MRRTESTPYALLGLISIQPMSGYDIRKAIQEDLIYFWNESFGQIYPALKRLTRQGLIAPIQGSPSGRRQRRTFKLTAKGRSRLREWLALPPQDQPIRNEFLLKLFLGKCAPPNAICHHLRRYRQAQLELLKMFRKIRAVVEVEHARKDDQKFWLVMLDHGIRIHRAELTWCDASLQTLRSSPAIKQKPLRHQRYSTRKARSLGFLRVRRSGVAP